LQVIISRNSKFGEIVGEIPVDFLVFAIYSQWIAHME
jgi:hypothetical protein